MNDDLENVCMSVLTEASHKQLGTKLAGPMKIMMSVVWNNLIKEMPPEQRKDGNVLCNTVLTAINMGLSNIADNFTKIINNGRYQELTDPSDTRFNELFHNQDVMSSAVNDYLNEVFRSISSIDENAILDKYMSGNQNVQSSQTNKQTSVQQDAEMLERIRAAQAEQDPSKRMKMLADIDAEIDRQKGKI